MSHTNFKDENDCPVIGILTESVRSLYQSNIWIGVSDTAIKMDYGVLCFAGGSLVTSPWDQFEPQRNAIYDFIDTNKLKGLIISGSLGSFITPGDFEDFYQKFKNIPMVCLGPEIKSLPTVVFDNVYGMRALISHLVSYHLCRKIAFIRGPEGNKEAEERLKIFKEVLAENGLSPSEDLIVPGDFSQSAGANAVKYLVDQQGQSFDALVGANDDMAIGALRAFQERHIRVPDEVLVVGFDGIEESCFSIPPLTTVRQPLYEIGAKAVELLINAIEGKTVPEKVIIPATVEIRQSCGCFRLDNHINNKSVISSDQLKGDLLGLIKNEAASGFKKIRIGAECIISPSDMDEFIDTFYKEIIGEHGHFLKVSNKIAWLIASTGSDVSGLVRVMARLRGVTSSYFSNNISPSIEELFQNVNIGIVDAASRAQANRRIESENQAVAIRMAGQAIASAFDLDHLIKVVHTELNKLGIRDCWLSLYQDPLLINKCACVLALRDNVLTIPDESITEFNVPDIAPKGIIPVDVPGSFLLEPLYFRSEQIGFIVFKISDCRNGLVYELLRQYISSALKGALLMKKVQEQSLALENANLQLQKLREAEHAYIEGVKRELELGREIQGSFLPREMPKIDGWEICSAFQPAREVSGDFYDVFILPTGHIAMIIADVSGKDVGAALFMALTRTLIRALSEVLYSGITSPLDTINLTNNYLINHHYGNNGRYMYVTLFMAILDLRSNTVTYVNAGHNSPAIVSASGGIRRWVETTGPAIGIIPDARFNQNKIQLEPGEMLFAYTDGVTEARNGVGELFSKNRLAKILENKFSTASDAVKYVDTVVKKHCEGLAPHDDITMLVLRRDI